MELREIKETEKKIYDASVTHIIQSFEWGEFRKKLGIPLKRYGLFENGKLKSAFQITFHKIPFTKKFVGYLPKGPFPNKEFAKALKQIAKEESCAFIKIEPNIENDQVSGYREQIAQEFKPSKKPLFTKYNFVLDLTRPEAEILKSMHPKTRYNINLAEKKGVKVEEREDDGALDIYLKLYFETTKRQGYHGHNENYHRQVFKTLKERGLARLLIAFYTPEGEKNKIPLTAWMLLNFKDTLYYPYGGSSHLYRDVMSSNLVAWEAIKLGKKLKLKQFDLWGALGPDADPKDPWFGFHRFKKGYGGNLVEYIGSFDIILDKALYLVFNKIDKATKLKVFLLKAFSKKT